MRTSAPPRPTLGSVTPRLFTRPLVEGPPGPCGCGCALTPKTSKGFSAIDFAENVLGFVLLPWQRWLFVHVFEVRPDGRFRYRTVLILIGRQNGKTSWVEIKNLWKMFVLQVPLVIGTAQILDYAEESWSNAILVAEGVPDLAAEIAHVDKTNGKKLLRLTNGSRWKIAAASRRGGRSLSADDVNLDELREHQNWDSWAAVSKTTLARPSSQVFASTNAGDDTSVVLNNLQVQGRAAVEHPDEADQTLGHFEWSAPDDVRCTCERVEGVPHGAGCMLLDRALWAMANPSLGYTITDEALASALATDPTNVFVTECLCVRVKTLGTPPPIPEELWLSLADVGSQTAGDVALGVHVAPDQGSAAIAVHGPRADGRGHGEVIAVRSGVSWVVPALVKLKEVLSPVAIGLFGASSALLAPLAKVGITPPVDRKRPARGDLAVPYASDLAEAWGGFLVAVNSDDLRHRDQVPLTAAVGNAKVKKIGEAEGLDVRASTGDVGPLNAVIGARWAYVTRIDRIMGDLVFEDFDPAVHEVDRFDIPAAWPRHLAVRFGYQAPFTCQWWAEDPDGALWMYREIYMTGRLVEEHAETILRLSRGEPKPATFVADHDADDRPTLQRHLGMGSTAAKKTLTDGVQAVASRLKAHRLFLLRDSLVERDRTLAAAELPTCLAEEIAGYVWAPGKEAPVEEHDAGCTAARYLVASKDLRKRAGTRGWI